MGLLDRYLDRITMYRLVVYYLLCLIGVAMLLGAVGHLPYSPVAISLSAAYLALIAWLSNRVFAAVFQAPANPESSLITALILALIITPPAGPSGYLFLTAAAGLAIASKYLLAWRGKHFFNPAAIAVVLTSAGAGQSASWWVGSAALAPYVLIGGLLVVRKTQRGQMVAVFMGSALVATAALALISGGHLVETITRSVTNSSLLFLAFVMLTEPLTSPTRLSHKRWYALIVGVLWPPQFHLGALYTTPELALVVGNLYAYIVTPHAKRLLKLRRTQSWGHGVKDFIFSAEPLAYQAGQYMEFTLPHEGADNRGSRRFLTLASSPTESNLRIGVKFYRPGSSFKRSLGELRAGSIMAAGQLGGDFVLPDERRCKLAFIAGGIGVTPFRSMVKYMLDTNDTRPMTLIYSERTAADLAYSDVFNEAQDRPQMKVVYTLSAPGVSAPEWMNRGSITAELIQTEIPDFLDRLFYVSGPHSMVTTLRGVLRGIGVDDRNIKADFFPGYA